MSQPIDVKTVIDLPDVEEPVTFSLHSNGVSFITFAVELFLGNQDAGTIVKLGREVDLAREFPMPEARALRGLSIDCAGAVGSGAAAHIVLRCEFRVAGEVFRSHPATIELTDTVHSREFHLRTRFK